LSFFFNILYYAPSVCYVYSSNLSAAFASLLPFVWVK
jgi:hypothetical protein